MAALTNWANRIFGAPVTKPDIPTEKRAALSGLLPSRGGWFPIIKEAFTGAWQHNVEYRNDTLLQHYAVWSCMTLIASDISKLRVRIVEKKDPRRNVWEEAGTDRAKAYTVLRDPNWYQTRMQFWESWMLSKLSNGNTYVLLRRNAAYGVDEMHVLDPNRVQVLVSPAGEVFYRLSSDHLSGIETDVTVPAADIIHDRWNTLFHPLIGMSPISAAAISAMQGMSIQKESAAFFKNRGVPSGVLTAPGEITDATAARLKAYWEAEFSGDNAGNIAVLGDDLKFMAMTANAVDSQLIEQLKWSGEVVCSVFHVPLYKVNLAPAPALTNIQALNTEYYSQALQVLIEAAEGLLDRGLNLEDKSDLGTDFDLSGLLRMDTAAQMQVANLGIAGGALTPDEARIPLNLPTVPGGSQVYMQQQMWPLQVLGKRTLDALVGADKPQALAKPEEPKQLPAPDEPAKSVPTDEENERSARALLASAGMFDFNELDELV